MKILHETQGVLDFVVSECTRLAVSEAPAMVVQHIDFDSPLLPLAEAEVEILLGKKLRLIGSRTPVECGNQWVEAKAGVIVAIDPITPGEDPLLAGFIQYTEGLFVNGVAWIGYAAVHPDYRGKGLFSDMLDVLKASYPVIGLDCPLELVPMYERLGFVANNVHGSHVGMSLGKISGKTLAYSQGDLDKNELYQRALGRVSVELGDKTQAAFAKRDADTARRAEEVRAYLSERK